MQRQVRCVYTDGDGIDAAADDADLIMVSFSRREVMAGLTGDAVDRLLHLSEQVDRVRRFEGALLIQFEGFDQDPREVVAIPDCRAYFQALTRNWPFWFHFLAKRPDEEQLSLAIGLLTPMEQVPSQGPGANFRMDPREFGNTMRRLFHAMNTLHEQHGMDGTYTVELTDRIMVALERAYGGSNR